jgi:predicted transcriptional regulator
MRDIKSVILDTIRDNPGIRYRELLRAIGVMNGVLSYHINLLERENAIVSERYKGMVRYYLKGIDKEEARILGMLRIPMVKVIVEFMLDNEPCSLTTLSQYLDRSKSTISWHLKRLIDEGIVIKHNNVYYTSDKDNIKSIILKYKKELEKIDTIDLLADNYTDIIDDLRF